MEERTREAISSLPSVSYKGFRIKADLVHNNVIYNVLDMVGIRVSGFGSIEAAREYIDTL